MGTLYTPELTNEKILQMDQHRWRTFCADCRLWEAPTKLLHSHQLNWHEVKFERSNAAILPESMGVYMFVLRASNALMTNGQHSYIMYVGQAINLKERFTGYFKYVKSKKPSDQLKRIMILLWQERLQFHYFETPNFTKEELTNIEFDLIDMTIPPMNNLFRGEFVNQNVKAYAPR
ncbi:hypothetical protein WBJ53_27100 [Spirosoma sp. SC4-14]|uniref:GIY-YIG nuclease family protein n=1 Tax=Spirosoma sp. SC4-14 TaxID=3128900 RepID=UPI0030CC79CF